MTRTQKIMQMASQGPMATAYALGRLHQRIDDAAYELERANEGRTNVRQQLSEVPEEETESREQGGTILLQIAKSAEMIEAELEEMNAARVRLEALAAKYSEATE